MTLPVSVVVPHKTSRKEFFERFCLPSIKANLPAQIVVKENDGSDPRLAQVARNAGAREAKEPFLIFVDDDAVLATDCLGRMLGAMRARPGAAYAYCDFLTVPLEGQPVQTYRAPEFDAAELLKNNYINTMSLMRREAFPGFDESLRRLQDWDLWLTMLARGHKGVHVPEVLIHRYSVDPGISGREDLMAAVSAVVLKHAPAMLIPK